MKVLVLNHEDVRKLLPMNECIQVMEDVFNTLAKDDAVNPLRNIMWLPDKRGLLGTMPAYVGGEIRKLGLKAASVFPGNHGSQFDAHQGAVLLFETDNGVLQAIVDATEITAIRTAAVSGFATRMLARKDASRLAIIGSGVQARSHLAAMLEVREIKTVSAWSPNAERLERFAEYAKEKHEVSIELCDSSYEAVKGADIICTTTASEKPVVLGEWLEPGCHINAVGSSVPTTRELDTRAVSQARMFVDRKESTINESGDFLFAKNDGAIDESHILAELGEVLVGRHSGREKDSQITLFKSLGLAVEDVASANHCYKNAIEQGVGTEVELGTLRA